MEVVSNADLVASRPSHVKWGAVFAGTFVALGIWILLFSLGLALGLSSVNPNDASTLKGAGIFTGVWGAVTPLVALFIGGWVSARTSGVLDRVSGVIHGAVVWSLATLLGLWAIFALVGTVVSGAAKVGGGVVSGVGSAVSGAVKSGAPQQAAQGLGIDANTLLGPINQQLQAQGAPPVTANQLQAVIGDVAKQGIQGGKVDRDALVASVTRNTSLSGAQANMVADRVEQSFNQAKQQAQSAVQKVGQDVEHGALSAVGTSGKTFWGIFIALALGLLSAALGALTGASLLHRHVERTTAPVRQPIVRREVNPRA